MWPGGHSGECGSMRNFLKFFLLGLISLLSACSGKSPSSTGTTTLQNLQGPEIQKGEIKSGDEKIVQGPFGSNLRVVNLGAESDSLFLEVEGTLSPDSFSLIKSKTGERGIHQALEKAAAEVKKSAGGISISSNDSVGYFSFWIPYHSELLSALKNVEFEHEFYFKPVHYDLNVLKEMKAYSALQEGFSLRSLKRGGTKGFSGLEKMGAVEFAQKASQDTGSVVDGSSVRVGIGDTGVTFNHPTFRDASGKSRVVYMKDFTREGRVYFNPAAKFQAALVKGTDDEYMIQAQIITPTKLPTQPDPSKFSDVKDMDIIVSPELKKILDDPKQKISLGIFSEAAMNSASEPVDLNANGHLDDQIPILYVMGNAPTDDRIFIDFSATGDFSSSKPIGDFNLTGDVLPVFAEKIGFDIQTDALPKVGAKDSSEKVELRSVSIVGFDPGDHGTHVSGIAAGRKTILNDSDDTLARGVAPNSKILVNRVCANNGGCNELLGIIDLVTKGGAEVVNLSLGGSSPFNDGFGVVETVINRLSVDYNVIFMVAAGNEGPGRQTLGTPSTARLSLSIGATASKGMISRQYQWPASGPMASSGEDDDFMLFFSSRGPRSDGGFKPNLTAPGTELSSVQLNSAPGARSGLDVYWGTSMATPSATGAYALFLDAIKKYNLKNSQSPLSTNALVLRNVLMGSARFFGKNRYSWIDEGAGMINLPAAWELLKTISNHPIESGVKDLAGKPLELDYQVFTSYKTPSGLAYDGSRFIEMNKGEKTPIFGSGVWVDAEAQDTLKTVQIARRLPENLSASTAAGEFEAQLRSSAEEFVLKSDFGNDPEWFKAGTLGEVDCLGSEVSNLTVLGRGVEIQPKDDGSGALNPFLASSLNICLNRELIRSMPAGDHGALIYGYRSQSGVTSPVPSFIVPVYFTQVNQVLSNSTAYEILGRVQSFGVDRNYVKIPKSTSLLQLTLEVPAVKASGPCSGVELMMLEGGNTLVPSETRKQMRVSNCNASDGSPITDPAKRRLTLIRSAPVSGTWDVDVFGQYQFPTSDYKLRVDYLVGQTSVNEVKGTLSQLSGDFGFLVKEASLEVKPDPGQSKFLLTSLFHKEESQVENGKDGVVGGPLGQLRVYPQEVDSVIITTGGAPHDDIDLFVFECPMEQADVTTLSACTEVGSSTGPTDVEKVKFKPKKDKKYAIRVSGETVKDSGKFVSGEEWVLKPESGILNISGVSPAFGVHYDFSGALGTSQILTNPFFVNGSYVGRGSITLSSAEGVALAVIPVTIQLK